MAEPKHTERATRAADRINSRQAVVFGRSTWDIDELAGLIDRETNLPALLAERDELQKQLAAARAEAFAYGRCCDLYQDSLGQFHCHECGQRTFAMLQGVQRILGDSTEVAMSHEESIRVALVRKAATETAEGKE